MLEKIVAYSQQRAYAPDNYADGMRRSVDEDDHDNRVSDMLAGRD